MITNLRRNVLKLVALSIAPVALAVFLAGLGSGFQKAHAAVDPAVNMSLSMTGCDSTLGPSKCSVPVGGTATVSFNVLAIPASGYSGYDLLINFAGNINYKVGSLNQAFSGSQPPAGFACDFPTGEALVGVLKTDPTQIGNGTNSTACAQGLIAGNPKPASHFVGVLATFRIVCKSSAGSGTVGIIAGDGSSDLVDPSLASHSESQSESLTINCVQPPTPTPGPSLGGVAGYPDLGSGGSNAGFVLGGSALAALLLGAAAWRMRKVVRVS